MIEPRPQAPSRLASEYECGGWRSGDTGCAIRQELGVANWCWGSRDRFGVLRRLGNVRSAKVVFTGSLVSQEPFLSARTRREARCLCQVATESYVPFWQWQWF